VFRQRQPDVRYIFTRPFISPPPYHRTRALVLPCMVLALSLSRSTAPNRPPLDQTSLLSIADTRQKQVLSFRDSIDCLILADLSASLSLPPSLRPVVHCQSTMDSGRYALLVPVIQTDGAMFDRPGSRTGLAGLGADQSDGSTILSLWICPLARLTIDEHREPYCLSQGTRRPGQTDSRTETCTHTGR